MDIGETEKSSAPFKRSEEDDREQPEKFVVGCFPQASQTPGGI